MKLIACPDCHTQFDVTEMVQDSEFDCRCGATLRATPPKTAETLVRRCSGCGALAQNDDELCDYCGAGIIQVVDRGSLICPECYARNLDDARFCLGCGVAFDPQSPKATLSELRCPCCECWMTSREVGGLEIQECPKCNGLWAPEGRFDLLVDRATAATRDKTDDSESIEPRVDGGNPLDSKMEYRRCPVCDALMNRKNFQKRSGVIVDRCYQHGTWLDANELERIAGFVLSGRAARASAAEAVMISAREKQASRSTSTSTWDLHMSSGQRSIFGTNHRGEMTAATTIFDLLVGIFR